MKKRRACRLLAALVAVLLSGCAGKQAESQGNFRPSLDTRASVQLETVGFFGNFDLTAFVTGMGFFR